jgi:hypothetical protein
MNIIENILNQRLNRDISGIIITNIWKLRFNDVLYEIQKLNKNSVNDDYISKMCFVKKNYSVSFEYQNGETYYTDSSSFDKEFNLMAVTIYFSNNNDTCLSLSLESYLDSCAIRMTFLNKYIYMYHDYLIQSGSYHKIKPYIISFKLLASFIQSENIGVLSENEIRQNVKKYAKFLK